MTFDEEDHVARRNLPYSRFHEGCHPDVLQRLTELMDQPSRNSAQMALALAKNATLGAEALARAVARTPLSAEEDTSTPSNNLSRPA